MLLSSFCPEATGTLGHSTAGSLPSGEHGSQAPCLGKGAELRQESWPVPAPQE